MRFYILFNSISVISGRWKVDKAVCNGTPFTVEKISPRVGIELGPLQYRTVLSQNCVVTITLTGVQL